ncbi:MAG TPA: hypothetical protein VKC60_11735 [Opitutaceae bacterium]|nr:hypothetical protein [Opitutaceae bacterium]
MKWFSSPILIVLLCLSRLPSNAAPTELEAGLIYIRAPTLLVKLPDGAVVILDLRGTAGDETTAQILVTEIKKRAPKPTLMLINSSTSAAVVQRVPHIPGLLTLAPSDVHSGVTLSVKTTAEEDNRAVAALAAGTSPTKLIEEKMKKARYDEATLMRDHANGSEDAPDTSKPNSELPASSTPKDSSVAKKADDKTETAKEEVPVRDAVLQRAVQLYRALIALGRLQKS